MRTRRIIIMIVVVILATVLAFLPDKDNSIVQVDPETIHYELNQNTRFYTTDEVADLLINEDPSLVLIDVRNADEYEKFHLTGAINISLADILTEENAAIFGLKHTRNVLYSNGSVMADQAWMLLRRKAFEHVYVMKGGLNHWVETILQPSLPSPVETDEAVLDQYLFRKAASQYFGKGQDITEEVKMEAPKVQVERKKVETKVAGGC